MRSNKMIIHYAGGAGINVARDIGDNLSALGSGFCKIIPKYIDTSVNNMSELGKDNLWQVGSPEFGDATIHGSGGERRSNSTAIVDSVKEYLDTNHYGKEVIGEFHVVVFSASGGSGSVIAPTLISNLRARGLSVVGVMIGDSSNGLSCKNTLNTIATLDHMSKKTLKKPIVMFYYNNHTVIGSGITEKETYINSLIFNSLSTLSLFTSGMNEDIDTKDMINFLSPDNYKTISIAPSLYCLTIHNNNKVINDDTVINLIGRTLTVSGVDSDIGVTLLQHKYGKVVDESAAAAVAKFAPVHMVLTGNYMVEEHKLLTNTVAEYSNISDSIVTTDLAGAGEVDDDGMIF